MSPLTSFAVARTRHCSSHPTIH